MYLGNVFHHTTLRSLLENAEGESVIAEAEVVENHLHNYERWFGASGGQVGPGLQTSLTPFRVTSGGGANTFGVANAVFTGVETPTRVGMTKFDFHRIHVVDAQNNNKNYRLRVANNSLGHTSWASAVADGVYSDACFRLSTGANQPQSIEIQSLRLPSGTIVWVAVATLDVAVQWLDFLVGIHEYAE